MNAVWRFRERLRGLVAGSHSRCWIAMAFVVCAGDGAAQDIDRIRALVLAGSVLKVEAVDGEGRLSLGTAVAVGRGTFVTNCHVTRRAQLLFLVRDGARWAVDQERADLYFDLCLLRVAALADIPPIPLAEARGLQVREPVMAAGYSGGMAMQVHAGVVNALHALGGSKVIQATTAFTSGASGGALLNTNGRLVGILTFRLRGADGYYFASPVDWIADHVDDASGFVAVAPLAGEPPFWARPMASLPLFMQAASLEHDERWNDLLALTDRWSRASPGDAEALYLRGSSLAHQGEWTRAIDAFRDAVTLDPHYVRAWLDLGKVYATTGALADARRIIDVLADLDPESAAELQDTLPGETR